MPSFRAVIGAIGTMIRSIEARLDRSHRVLGFADLQKRSGERAVLDHQEADRRGSVDHPRGGEGFRGFQAAARGEGEKSPARSVGSRCQPKSEMSG